MTSHVQKELSLQCRVEQRIIQQRSRSIGVPLDPQELQRQLDLLVRWYLVVRLKVSSSIRSHRPAFKDTTAAKEPLEAHAMRLLDHLARPFRPRRVQFDETAWETVRVLDGSR